MNNSTPYDRDELLMRYLDGELSDSERREFEQQLQQDERLQRELESLQLAKQAVISYGLKEQVAAIHQTMMVEMKEETPVRQIKRNRKAVRWSISIAAAALLFFIGIKGYEFYKLSPDRLYNDQYSSYELTSVRGNGVPSPVEQAYRAKDYRSVIAQENGKQNASAEDEFLAGLSYLQLNDAANAISSFTKVISQNEATSQSTYKDEAEYYLALAYLKNKDYDQALTLMRSIHNNPSHLYHEKFSNGFIRKVKMLKWR